VPKSAVRSRRSVATVTGTAVIGASLAVLLLPVATPLASAAAAPGSTQRASLKSPDNTAADDGGRESVLSGNGESVVFTSSSSLDPSLKGGTGSEVNYRNVFVRDLVRQRTVMISRGQFHPPQTPPSSGGGIPLRYGPNKVLELAPGEGGGTQDGVPIEDTPPNESSFAPSISADGRFVAFATAMSNMFLGDNAFSTDIAVVDRDPDGDGDYDEEGKDLAGRPYRLYKYFRVTGREGEFGSPYTPKLAGNASRVVWKAKGDGHDSLLSASLNLRGATPTLGPIEQVPTPNVLNFMRIQQDDPAISGDGSHIVSHAEYEPRCDGCEVPNFHAIISTDMSTPNRDAFRVDIDGGKPVSTTGDEVVKHPAVNGNGSVIAFVAENEEFFPPEPTTYAVQITGTKVTRTDIVSRDNKFTIINGDRPGLSGDGRYLAFVTNNLNAHDGADGQPTDSDCIRPPSDIVRNSSGTLLRLNALLPRRNAAHTTCQVIMRDLVVDRERLVNEKSRLPGTLVSPNKPGDKAGNGNTVPDVGFATAPSLSDNGGRVAYDSDATDLVSQPADDNRKTDVFVRTLEPTLTSTTVEFGQVQINTTSTKTAQLTATGQGPLVVEQITIGGQNAGEFSVGGQTCIGQTIHETGGCEVSVKFSPKTTGDKRGQLVIQLRGHKDPVRVDLTGTGTEVPVKDPEFAAGPDPLNFGSRLLLSKGPESAVTITNKGEAALQIQAVDIVGPGTPEDYKVTTNTCGSVPGGGQCTVSVAFSPTASGGRTAVLRFTDNAPGGPHLVGLSGSAPQPTIQVNPGVTPPGRVVTVIGKDFPPVGLPVTVKFDGRPGETTIIPKDDGTFQAQLLVFPKSSPETRQVLAQMPQFSGTLANAPLLVVLATVSPANFVVRG
jgi:hypothetical protein